MRFKDMRKSPISQMEKDHATYQMAITILNEELEHEHDIEDFIADIERLKEDIRQFRL
ncbi:MAG: hypothetical protein LRY35_00005 [Clostridiales bacterium]|nr:hypothetical protein [Clostridiales bacterium]